MKHEDKVVVWAVILFIIAFIYVCFSNRAKYNEERRLEAYEQGYEEGYNDGYNDAIEEY